MIPSKPELHIVKILDSFLRHAGSCDPQRDRDPAAHFSSQAIQSKDIYFDFHQPVYPPRIGRSFSNPTLIPQNTTKSNLRTKAEINQKKHHTLRNLSGYRFSPKRLLSKAIQENHKLCKWHLLWHRTTRKAPL